MKLKESGRRVLAVVQGGAVGLAATAGSAMAQTSYDTSSVTTQITAAVAAILLIGAAVVAGPKIAIKVWKWIGRAL